MRNIFDQYDQPENKLTHALACALAKDRNLLVPFLRWLNVEKIPLEKDIRIVEQQIPGTPARDDDIERDGLPDLCLYTDAGWIVLFEMKLTAPLTGEQLKRHAKTARRAGYLSPQLVAVTVEKFNAGDFPETILKQWRHVYALFDHQQSDWAATLTDYMAKFEAKAVAKNYEIRGTITMFNGLHFDSDDNPYTYLEAKRLIRLLGDELRARSDLQSELGVDPSGQGRPAITDGLGDGDGVWDFLPLVKARGAPFTRFPHLTIAIRDICAIAAITIPDGVSGGFRTRLKDIKLDGFLNLICEIERRLHPVTSASASFKPLMYATQRHYRTQRSLPTVDGRIEVDLRTCVDSGTYDVKFQPEWAEALYHLLVNKRSNIQFGIEMQFDYTSPIVRSPDAASLFANSWKAMKPLLDFVLSE